MRHQTHDMFNFELFAIIRNLLLLCSYAVNGEITIVVCVLCESARACVCVLVLRLNARVQRIA